MALSFIGIRARRNALSVYLKRIIGTVFEWALCGNFFLAVQDFRMGIPGMLIQWFGGYALLKAIAKK